VLGIAAVVGVGVVGYAVGRGSGQAATQPVEIEGIRDDMERLAALAQGVTRGDDDAPITIIEFGDHQCPSCAVFAQQVKPRVDLELVETGAVKFIFYDYPLVEIHPNAFLAARGARCAEEQGRFWDYQDHLFRTQPRWSALPNPGRMFEEFARTLELDDGAFSACLNSDRHAELVTANLYLAEVLQIPRTPTILLEHGGSTEEVLPSFEAIQSRVRELLGETAP
jgi:protein-disulfide isomerase